MLCCDFSKKYDFIFDFDVKENKNILYYKNENENLMNCRKKIYRKN